MLKKLLTKAKKRPFLSGGIIIAIIVIIIVILSLRNGNTTVETMVITRGDFISEVSASGKVTASQNSNLGFDQSGRVSGIYVNVGDKVKAGTILASIENGTARADVIQKQANLEKEQARLASLERGTRVEQLAITQQKYTDASSALIIAMSNAYLQIESAILSEADTLFNNGNSVNPVINITVQSGEEKRSIETERLIVGEKLAKWKKALAFIQTSTSSTALSTNRIIGAETISATRIFLNHLSSIASNIMPGNSGRTQSEIDAIRATINSAEQGVSAAASAEQTAYAAWTVAFNNLNLEKSGSTQEDIDAQKAQVRAAEADLSNSQAQVRKTLIIAPFDGIITKMDAKIGEVSSPNVSQITIISTGLFEIESYIPEVSIARLSVGNPATVTLDAYGSDVEFKASIISIDPAETIRDGVSTYKTRLQFSLDDARIKPGMTANIRITAERKSDVIVIPKSVISEKDGFKTVQVKIGDVFRETPVQTGSVTALGQIEITSGLSENDIIVLPSLDK